MEIRALLSALWRNKTGPMLVAVQIAIALAVVVNVTYIVQQRLADVNKPTGLDLENMFWVATQPNSADYPFASAVKADLAYLNALPGVVAATTTNPLPQTFSESDLPFATDPQIFQQSKGSVDGIIYFGTDKFIETMGLKFVAGRNFDANMVAPPAADWGAAMSALPPEIIVTRAMADKLFPNGNALGKTVYVGLINKSTTIIGIVDLMQAFPASAPLDRRLTQIVILPIAAPGPAAAYVVRAKPGRRDELMAKVEKDFADLRPGRFINRMEAYDVTAANTREGLHASAVILAAVAVFVLTVTVIGIVGLAAFSITTRTRQLGTRRAIGARKFHILRYFLVENWLITTGGAVVGCTLALAAGLQLGRVYQMPRLPLYYLVGGVLLMWVVGLFAVLVPALRAASISPAIATRTV